MRGIKRVAPVRDYDKRFDVSGPIVVCVDPVLQEIALRGDDVVSNK